MDVQKMRAPELFRPPIDIPEVSYDQLVRTAAQRHPEKAAIKYYDLVLTYREAISMINSIANGLHDIGLRKGDRLCIYTANRPEFILTFIAAASLGVVVSPVNPSYKERELAHQLEDSEAVAILIQRELVPIFQLVRSQHELPHLKHILVTGIDIPEHLEGAETFAALLRRSSPRYQQYDPVTPDDLLALPYSSGTTGLPKGTMLTHRNLVSNNIQFLTALQPTDADTALLFLPFYHIYGIMLTGSFLACGGTQVIMERFDLLQALELCEKHAVTYVFVVPPIVLALAHAPIDLSKLKTVRYILSGAAPMPPEPARQLQEKTGIITLQGYGLTEASPLTHAQPKDPALIRLESIGLLTHNTEQKIVDLETGERELPPGEDGELIIRGPQVMQGYWKAPEETAKVLRNGWLYTGDIGHVDEDGYTYIVDRKKEMIKYKGFSIAPAEVEALLLEHPAVGDAAVIGIPDKEAGELVKGFIVPRRGQQANPEEIMAFVNSRLAGYKKIHHLEIIDAIPKNASGKILRRVLKERAQNA